MTTFLKEQFARTGCEMHLGYEYSYYWTIELVHLEKGSKVDILLDSNGDLVSVPNEITNRIRQNYVLDGINAKIIPISISGQSMITIKWPPIPKE